MKIVNCKLIIAVLFMMISFVPKSADAGLLLQRPLYIGLGSGLVGSWTFDGPDMANVTAFDRSGQGNNGALTNGPKRTIGRIGQALNFDGSDDLVNMSSPASLDDVKPITVSAWIKPNSTGEGGIGTIVSKMDTGADDGRWMFYMQSTNAIEFFKDDGTPNYVRRSSNSTITIGAWQHVVATWDGSTNMKIYINGTETTYQTSTNGSGARSDAVRNFGIGNINNGSQTFDGLIDDVRVYNRVLSSDEIKRLYKIGATFKIGLKNIGRRATATSTVNVSPKGQLTSGLVGLWSFDGPDMANVTAFDRSGNSNNGTLTNGPTRAIGRIGQALNFDGSNDLVNVGSGSSIDNLDVFTYAGWIYVKVFPANSGTLLFQGNDRICDVDNRGGVSGDKTLRLFVNRTTDTNIIAADNLFVANTWYHVACVFDLNGTNRLYINGSEPSLGTDTQGSGAIADDPADDVFIGANSTEGNPFNGLIDEVRVYNRVLNADEIKRLYNQGR